GGADDDSFRFGAAGKLTGKIDGGGQGAFGNAITGNAAANTFFITGANAGSIANLLPVGFVNIENLFGGANDDTFKFVGAGALTGAIDGGGQGAVGNTIVGNNAGDNFTITGTNAGAITGLLPTFSHIQNLAGGSA